MNAPTEGWLRAMTMNDAELNLLFCEWASWCRSKRLYSPNPNPKSIIGTLRMPSGGREPGDRRLDAELAHLHLAILASGDRGQLIAAHYLLRPYHKHHVGYDTTGAPIFRRRMVKELAGAVGIETGNWHRSVKRACRDAYSRMSIIRQASATEETA